MKSSQDPVWVFEFELYTFLAHQSYNKYVMTYNVSETMLLSSSGTDMEKRIVNTNLYVLVYEFRCN